MSETKESFVPKILADYHQNNRTGILTLKQKSINKTIHFENGNIVFATTNVEAEQLGTRLLEWGLLTPEQLIATDKLAKENRRFGKSLVELGFFQPDELPELFYRLATRIIYSTFGWQNFDFRFTRCALPEYEAKNLIAVPQVLLEGIRYLEDLDLIKSSIENLNSSLKLALSINEINNTLTLNNQETILLTTLDTKVFTIEKVLSSAFVEEETSIKLLCVLNLLGFIATTKHPPSAELFIQPNKTPTNSQISNKTENTPENNSIPVSFSRPVVVPITQIPTQHNDFLTNPTTPTALTNPNASLEHRSVMEFCYEIENKVSSINRGASIYEVLEVNASANYDQIQASYQRLSKHFNPNRQQELSVYNTDVSANLNYISTAIKQAYEILASKITPSKPINLTPASNVQNSVSNALANNKTSTPSPQQSTSKQTTFQQSASPNSPKLPTQQEVMEFCYSIENKLNMIRGESTHYQVLEVERNASRETIEQACNQLMLQFDVKKQEMLHPYGLNMKSQLEEISNSVKLAAEILSNPQKKQLYDEHISKALRRNTGQYSTLSQNDPRQTPTASHIKVENKYPTAPTYSSPDLRQVLPQTKPIYNASMPSLTTDSKMQPQQGSPNSNYLNQNLLSNSSPGQRVSQEFPSAQNQAQLGSTAYNRPASADLNRSSAGTKIPPSPTEPNYPNTINKATEGNRHQQASFTPIVASKATAQPSQPIKAQQAQPVQPIQSVQHTQQAQQAQQAQHTPVARSNNTQNQVPTELPKDNRALPGGKGKTFTATEYYLKSIELCDQKKYTEAIECLLMALKIAPKDGEYWAQLARAYSNIDGYEKDTLAAYQKANEYSPREVTYLLELGEFLRKHGYRKKAAEVYSGVLNIRPQNVKAQTALAELSQASEEEEEQEDTKARGFWSKWLKPS